MNLNNIDYVYVNTAWKYDFTFTYVCLNVFNPFSKQFFYIEMKINLQNCLLKQINVLGYMKDLHFRSFMFINTFQQS